MRLPKILTFADVIEHLIEWSRGHSGTVPKEAIMSAINAAYEDMAGLHDWPFLLRPGRIFLHAEQTDGTIAYDHTGGTYERELTLTDDTWPDWCIDASVRIGNVTSDIAAKKSTTVVTLDEMMNPGQDVDSGTGYSLYQRRDKLPADFGRFTDPMAETNWRFGKQVSQKRMDMLDRWQQSSGTIEYYSIAEMPDIYGHKAIYIYPRPTSDQTVDFTYWRLPRPLRYSGHASDDYDGTVVVTGSSVTGTGTAFASDMTGAVMRFSSDTTKPTGRFGSHPFVEERTIHAVADTTHLTLDNNVGTNRSGVRYVISDPMDLGLEAHNAFLRRCEMHLAVARNLDNKADVMALAQDALRDARAASYSVRDAEPSSVSPYAGIFPGVTEYP